MNIWQAIALGIVQGLTEFLPVSSSGHLVFFQKIFNVDLEGNDMLFDIMLHLGTLVAVCAVFYKDILKLFERPFKQLFYLLIATVPAAVAGFFLDDWIEQTFYGGAFLAVGFLITAAELFAAELYAKKAKKSLPLNTKIALSMGFAQMVAILPGISRSGSTIVSGTLAGGKREEVANFSFLLSVPVILGSFVVSIVKGISNGEIASAIIRGGANLGWCVFFGVVTSALSGLFAIKVMIKAIKKANYKWFALYLILLSVVCLVLQF